MRIYKIKDMLSITGLSVIIIIFIILFTRSGKPVPVETQKALAEPIVESIPATGKVRPVTEISISPDVSGEIVELHVKEGDAVKKGQVLLKIRQDQYVSLVKQATATLGNLKAQYHRQMVEFNQAQADYSRNLTLYESEDLPRSELEASKAALEMARNSLAAANYSVESAQAQLSQAQESLKKTTIRAPRKGIVSRLCVEKGERVVGTNQMAGTELLRIANLSKMELRVDINENDIVRIAKKDSVDIEIDAYPHRQFRGVVTQIANSAKNIDLTFEQVANFEVRIEILPDSARLLPGMSASASIIACRKDSCVTVPLQCIFAKDKEEYVWVVNEGNSVSKRRIMTGIQSLNRIEVVEGLSEGETVVIGPAAAISKDLSEGQKVRVR